MSIQNILGDVDGFVNKVISSLERDKIDVSNSKLDHICYRVESIREYSEYQQELSKLGVLLVEAEIGGRPISTYKLDQAIIVGNREISVVELPAPKQGLIYPSGFEHAEFVIAEEFQDFMNQYPEVTFDTKGISKAINPDIKINYDGFTVKFHYDSLEQVIKYEQQKHL